MSFRADQRLFLSYLVLVVGLVVALLLGTEGLLRRSLLRMVEDDLARELALVEQILDDAPAARVDSVADLVGELAGRRVTIVAGDGTVLGESTADGAELASMENHADRAEVRGALAQGSGFSVRVSETAGEPLLYVARRGADGRVLRIAVPVASVYAPLQSLHRGVLAVAFAATLLAAIFTFAFSVAATRPLRRIESTARAMTAGNLGVRLRERRRDEFGEVARALDSLAEELQRRRADLDEEQTRTRVLIDAMAEGVIALDEEGRVLRTNPAAQQIFGLPERLPVDAPEAISRRADFLRVVRRALAGESVPPTELVGDGRNLLATAQPLPEGGAVVVILDISRLRRLEGVRRDFVANASHELKTPLTAIRGYSETLLDPELPPELARRFARVVHSNADRLQRIVDDLLDLSRIETGGWVVHSETVAVEPMAREAWAETLRAAAGREIGFAVSGHDRAYCDPAALRQIFTNLFTNAIRHTPDGGRVEVRIARVPGDWLRIEVSDTGSGIPEIHLPRIFERFYRVDPARSREEGGTGLGLAIVKHLVEAHKGTVDARSPIGKGTTIGFTLPAA